MLFTSLRLDLQRRGCTQAESTDDHNKHISEITRNTVLPEVPTVPCPVGCPVVNAPKLAVRDLTSGGISRNLVYVPHTAVTASWPWYECQKDL